jgi:adenosylhomocysteinase
LSLQAFFETPAQEAEKEDLPLLRDLIARYSDERPFNGARVATSHILVRNSLVVVEALVAGGAEVLLCDAFRSPAADPVWAELKALDVPILSVAQAAEAADLFLDVNAVLGRAHTPKGAAEVTRTGIFHYEHIPCPVVSADDCRAKRIEGFFGTGDGFLRAWRHLRPGDPLEGKRLLQFGYGKIGRGVAHQTRKAGLQVTVADVSAAARAQAEEDGFASLAALPNPEMKQALQDSDIVVAVTGRPGVLGASLPPDWLRASGVVLVNLGAEDEYGSAFGEDEILGGKGVPLNFQLAQPTLNRYVDAPLAAHLLALEALVTNPEAYEAGVHPLPVAMDQWLLREWRQAWPDEDLTGIGEELGLV